ncbi:MAG: efflux RND transporter periplasmic adaptor subunit [Verrucomicrobiota bacterium]
MFYRIFIIGVIILAGLGVWKGAVLARQQSEKLPAPAPLAEPARSPFPHSLAATGIIEAARENVNVATSKAGLVIKVFPAVGAAVKAGAPLFQLDDREARARAAAAKAQVAVDTASVASQRVLQAEAVDQLKRVSQSGQARILSEDELNRRKFAVQTADSILAQRQASLEASQAQLSQAETELEVLTVRASRDGTILRVNLREGEYANVNPPEPLMILGDVDTLQIRADVDEQNAPLVESGRAAAAYLKGDSRDRLPLEFVRIDPFVVPKKSLTGDSTERVDTRVLQVIFSLARQDGRRLYVGQQVDIYIETSAPAPVPVAPGVKSTG